MRNDLVFRTKPLLITVGAVFGLLFVINIASVGSGDSGEFHSVFYALVLMIGGHITTSLSFRELHDPETSYRYLTLPASMPEKYLARLLLTSIGYVVISLVLYELFSLIAAGFTQLIFSKHHPLLSPFSPETGRIIAVYLATHGLTFFGAVFFRRLHLLNTILWAFLLMLAVGAATAFAGRIIFWDFFNGFFVPSNIDFIQFGEKLFSYMRSMYVLSQIIFYAAVPVFFWICGFVRFRETEV